METFHAKMLEGKFWSRTNAYRKKVLFAEEGIEAMLKSAERVYVSISFGKQSLVVAHMVYRVAPLVEMHFLASDETWMLYDYADVIKSFCEKWPINLHIHQTNRFSGAETWKDARDSGDMDLQTMCNRDDWDGWFWGLATEESPNRKKTLLSAYSHDTMHPSIFKYSDGKLRCCPIMHWNTRDLAAYIGLNEIPLLNIYKRFGLEQRTTARLTKKMVRNQGMALSRMCNSKGFRDLVDRFPEINIQ